ncbi:MAG: hypothetical protein ABJH98_02205 [Reichenbachiella sp.]|uniref:hypothetical protein n=1 Tax=Reichenbachiella sp. TaxID=2184521 RepID=UPI0032968A99
MTANLLSLLDKNGYTVFQTKAYFIVRKKVFTSFWLTFLLLSIGLLFFSLGTLILMNSQTEIYSLVILLITIGVGLILLPFISYLTAAYRSLVIDLDNKTLLFRAGYSRAYLFTEVNELKLEVQAKQTGTDPFSNSNKEFHYTITAYMDGGGKEELLSLKFRDEESERYLFDIKDYFQTLLTFSH